MLRALVLVTVVLAAGCEPEAPPPAPPTPPAPSPIEAPTPRTPANVVVYVTEWCPYCRAAREYLDARDVPYTAIDIEASEEAHAAYRDAGGTGGIPLIVVGQTVMRGYSEPALADALEEAGL